MKNYKLQNVSCFMNKIFSVKIGTYFEILCCMAKYLWFPMSGHRYYKLRHRVLVSEPKPLGPDWFGQTCRASLTSINEADGLRDPGMKDVKPVVSDGEKTGFDLSPVPSLPSQFAQLAVKGGLRNRHH